MDEYKPLQSEEDIRAKIVTAWLADHGFGPSDISVEYSFEVRLGRKTHTIDSEKPKKATIQIFRPRADVLVRSYNGRNLLIVEVKAPHEPLDDDVREQGICYARLLRKGGIAPFVVLTNGHETKIYDSISEELINGTAISLDHPHVKAGFRVNVDDIAFRAEALERFISLSPENLIEFCRQQVSYRMRFLRDEDPYSGKKYIPSLYVERKEAKGNLIRLLDEEKRRVILVVGSPQVGKTNFICHTVEERLEQGLPCLFYPAIGMGRGLLEAICEDFEWILSDSGHAYQIIHQKLQRILSRTGQKLTLFIDGWNEPDLVLARIIDRESERLSGYDIACVVSMTDISANRLLKDEVGNPSHIAEAAGIRIPEIPLFEMNPKELERQNKTSDTNPSSERHFFNGDQQSETTHLKFVPRNASWYEKLKSKWSVVDIRNYSETEVQEAYHIYAKRFNVCVPGLTKAEDTHEVWSPRAPHLVRDPFLLRIGMEQFRGQALPEVLDEPSLLEKSIELKSSRAIDLRDKCVPEILSELANELFSNGTPIRQSIAMKRWGLPAADEPPKGLFEAALLSKVCDERGLPALDFYYGRERDFVVANWNRDWLHRLKETQENVVLELSLAGKTVAGLEALRWFLKQPSHREQLQHVAQFFLLYDRPLIRRVILSSIREIIGWYDKTNQDWIRDVIKQGTNDSDLLVRVETIKLIALFTKEYEDVASAIDFNEEFISKLLEIEEEYPLGESDVGHIVLDAFRHIHGMLDEDSEISLLLKTLLDHNSHLIRIAAAKSLGYITPGVFLCELSKRIISSRENILHMRLEEYVGGVGLAVSQYEEIYYGSMCPGDLEWLLKDPEQLSEEYMRMYKICKPCIGLYLSYKCGQDFLSILRSLQPKKDILEAKGLPNIEQIKDQFSNLAALRYQLPLPFFEEFDTNTARSLMP